MTNTHGNPKDMTIKSNHNFCDIEKIEKYNEVTLKRLKQNISKDVIKQYPPRSNNMLACNIISLMKEHIGSQKSDISFLKSEIKEKNRLISFLISVRLTECTIKQPFSIRNSYKNSSEENKRECNTNTQWNNDGRISNETNFVSMCEIYLDTEIQNQWEINRSTMKSFTEVANIAETIPENQNESSDADKSTQENN